MCPAVVAALQSHILLPSAVLKLLKMATGMRALLDTVMQALPQVNTEHNRCCLFASGFIYEHFMTIGPARRSPVE